MANKCSRLTCKADGIFQPMVRFHTSIVMANGKTELAAIRVPMKLCHRCKNEATTPEIVGTIPAATLQRTITGAREKTGFSVDLQRTDIVWVRIKGLRTDG